MAWKVLTFLVLVAVVSADVATITPCAQARQANQSGETEETPPRCNIKEVRITPCQNKKHECKLRRGTEAQISMDFTPNFAATKLKTEVYNIGISRIKWGELNDDACQYTTCPTEVGKQQQFNYGLRIGKLLPRGKFTIEWQVFEETDNENMCCFNTIINLI